MADDTVASVIAPPQPTKARAGARTGANAGTKTATQPPRASKPRQRKTEVVKSEPLDDFDDFADFSESLIPVEYLPRDAEPAKSLIAPSPSHTAQPSSRVRPSGRTIASLVLAGAAFTLAAVGVTTNGWFARSLGSSDIAGWLFLAIGVAADMAALVTPLCAARLWSIGQRAASCAGWVVWAVTFVFAVIAGIGFASVNITDVMAERASRATPAVTAAQSALNDAMSARDRECGRGLGKYCREREAEVAERRQVVDSVMASVRQTADPQTDAAIKIVAWLSYGMLRPSGDDFAMLRLILLALLPQMGGILLMVSRSATLPSQADDVRKADVLSVWRTSDLRQNHALPQPRPLRFTS